MLTGFAIIVSFAGGMWVMFRATVYYEEKLINMARNNRPQPPQQRRVAQQRTHSKPMLDEDDYDRLMSEGRIVKRR